MTATTSDIARIQHLLRILGDYGGTVDGHNGPETEQAVEAFQKRQGLKQDGVPAQELIPLLRDELRLCLLALVARGLLEDDLDPSEAAIESALGAFQQKHGIEGEHGVLGPETRRRLRLPSQSLMDFETAFRAELGIIPGIPGRLDSPGADGDSIALAHQARLAGLAFSGGGIRSATFNLGVLQALAKHRMLGCFDYLSTVSGGGYIGGWFSALLRHHHKQLDDVETALAAPDKGRPESRHIRFLRSYSNYLTPRLGVLGLDTLAAVSTYLRNLLLNQTMLAAILGVILLLPRVANLLGQDFVWWAGGLVQNAQPRFGLAVLASWVFLAVAIGFAIWNLNCDRKAKCWRQGAWGVLLTVVAPLVVASWAGGYYLTYAAVNGLQCWHWAWKLPLLLATALAIGAVLARWLRRKEDQPNEKAKTGWWPWLLAALAAGAVGGALLKLLADLVARVFTIYAANGNGALELIGRDDSLRSGWLVPTLAAPLVLTAITLTAVLFIGLMGRGFSGFQREWWARLGGQLLRVQVAWMLLFAVAFLAAPVLAWAVAMAPVWLGSVGIGWAVTTLGGLFAAKSPATGADGANGRRWPDLLARVGPYVFLAGVFLLLAAGLDHILASHSDGCPENVNPYYYDLPRLVAIYSCSSGDTNPLPLWALLGACFAIAVILGRRVNVNVFSLHNFYHHRLVRCYLGGAREPTARRQDSYTGFDPSDELPLRELVQRPYPIVNAALNLTAGKQLAWQSRQSTSFVFTPLCSGYDRINPQEQPGNYRITSRYGSDRLPGGVRLGSAMAVSGAAASPNMGYHTSPAVAFLLTVFNVRLGRWCANPSRAKWQRSDPCFAPWYLFRELTGSTDEDSNFVYLSDGGHFENLGIYELVRRRCRYILVSDAAADDDYSFDDLGNAIRKCYADFGIRIEIRPDRLGPTGDPGRSAVHGVVGLVHYEDVDEDAQPGLLLYIKPTLSGDEPADILQYAARNKKFPQQPTADQWFDESQFESYRKLGHHIADTMLTPVLERIIGREDRAVRPEDMEAIFVALRRAWYPRSAKAGAFTAHTRTLDKIYERLRTDQGLAFLDRDFYPEWDDIASQLGHGAEVEPSGRWLVTDVREDALGDEGVSVIEAEVRLESAGEGGVPEHGWLPATEKSFRNGFYLCNSLIQLMEDVYLDLDLEREWNHPDNRGWFNLFKHWSWCPMFQATWAVCAGTFGARFQTFCEHRLGLGMGDICLSEPDRTVAEVGHRLNAVERGLIDQFLEARHDGERDCTVLVLSLRLRDQEARGKRLQGKPPASPIRFSVGFAVLDKAKQIVYFRIRDHLRKMGLARRALVEMWEKDRISGCCIGEMPPDSGEPFSREDGLRFERLFESARHEVAVAGHGERLAEPMS